MKTLITGSAGYIGSVLVGTLLDAGHEVIAVDNLMYGQHSLFHYCHDESFDFTFGDCRDKTLMAKAYRDVDVIIPLAAIVGAPACDRNVKDAWEINFGAVKMLNELRSKDQLIIFPTTNSGYGNTDGDIHCTEETPLNPNSIYAQTKVNAERMLLDSENLITLRLATVFGMSPRMRLDLMVNDFVFQAVKYGEIEIYEKDFMRNYVHVRDVADCILYFIDVNLLSLLNQPYNVGLDSANLSKEQIALQIKDHIPSLNIIYSDTGEDPDQRNYVVSNEKLRRAGFEARRTLDEGIQELIKGYRMIGEMEKQFKNV